MCISIYKIACVQTRVCISIAWVSHHGVSRWEDGSILFFSLFPYMFTSRLGTMPALDGRSHVDVKDSNGRPWQSEAPQMFPIWKILKHIKWSLSSATFTFRNAFWQFNFQPDWWTKLNKRHRFSKHGLHMLYILRGCQPGGPNKKRVGPSWTFWVLKKRSSGVQTHLHSAAGGRKYGRWGSWCTCFECRWLDLKYLHKSMHRIILICFPVLNVSVIDCDQNSHLDEQLELDFFPLWGHLVQIRIKGNDICHYVAQDERNLLYNMDGDFDIIVPASCNDGTKVKWLYYNI